MAAQRKARGPIIHRAEWVIADPWTIIPHGFVQVESGLIEAVGRGRARGQVVDHGAGALMPALVNTHTHLELSALKGKVPLGTGFRAWIGNLLREREALSAEALLDGAREGMRELLESGCCVVGEISTLGLTREAFARSNLAGVWFREYLGQSRDGLLTCGEVNEKQAVSLAGHGPYTTAPELLVELKQVTRQKGLPFAVHLAESEDEDLFIKSGRGPWADFLTERGIDFSGWGLPAASPVKHLDNLGILDDKTIAVHLIHADQEDFEILLNRNVHACLCLRSNRNLHDRLPDLAGMLSGGIRPCLGTDSPASTESLSLFDEMAHAAQTYPAVMPEEIMAMATINGARALGFGDRYGTLEPGKYAAMAHIAVEADSPSALLERIVHGDLKGPCLIHL